MSIEQQLLRFGPLRARVCRLRHGAFDTCLLGVTGPEPTLPLAAVRPHLAGLAAWLRRERVELLQDKLYGTPGAIDGLLASWREALGAAGIATWGQSPVANEGFAGEGVHGLQLWGLVGRRAGVRVEEAPEGEPGGRRFAGPGFDLVHLAGLRALPGDGELLDPETQAREMFRRGSEGLRARGLDYGHVTRTWIYFADVLGWYDAFNRVRDAHHRAEGVEAEAPPASTGIQGRLGGAACFMDLLAVKVQEAGAMAVRPLHGSERQRGAQRYGSAFSRGMVLESAAGKVVFVSGTASIDAVGRSTHVGDHEGQCLQTLLALASLLETEGGGLEHVAVATVFCKDEAAWRAFVRVGRLLRLPVLSGVAVRADICRRELLFEMEAVAVVPHGVS